MEKARELKHSLKKIKRWRSWYMTITATNYLSLLPAQMSDFCTRDQLKALMAAYDATAIILACLLGIQRTLTPKITCLTHRANAYQNSVWCFSSFVSLVTYTLAMTRAKRWPKNVE